jgi:uncharacterized protein RhaS with RHS repeats
MTMLRFGNFAALLLVLACYCENASARYLQSDPAGLGGGINTYGYANQNPLSFVDPDGLTSMAACANPINAAACAEAGIITRAGPIVVIMKDANCPDCKDLLANISAVAAEIRDRYAKMLADPRDLYNKAYCSPSLGKRIGTWMGHGDQIEQKKQALAKLIAQADAKNCPVDPNDRAALLIVAPPCPQ